MRFIYLLELQNKDCFSPLSIVTGLVHPQSQSLAEPDRRGGGEGVTCHRNRVSYHVFRGVFSDDGL